MHYKKNDSYSGNIAERAYELFSGKDTRRGILGKIGYAALSLTGLAALVNCGSGGGSSSGGTGNNGDTSGNGNTGGNGDTGNDGTTEPARASLTAEVSDFVQDGDNNSYYLTLRESNNVGVTLERRRTCADSAGCFPDDYDPLEVFGTTRIEPMGEIRTQNKIRFIDSNHPDRLVETWYGTDDNRNNVEVSYEINIP